MEVRTDCRQRRWNGLKPQPTQTYIRTESKGIVKKWYWLFGGVFTVAVILCGAVYTSHRGKKAGPRLPLPDPEEAQPPSPSRLHRFNSAAVCTDGPPCSRIGRDLLVKGGSAIDAALGALFCNGIVNSQSMGLGGGFMMTTYERKSKTALSLIAREAAPKAATADMYIKGNLSLQSGGSAVGVPGELRGYWEAWKRFGRLKWQHVVAPSIELCERGYRMTKHQHDMLSVKSKSIKEDPILRKTFVDPKTGDFYPQGSLIKLKEICRTLRVIAEEGGDAMYNGSLTKSLVEDLQEKGSIITEKDFNDYRAEWTQPISTVLHGGQAVYSAPPPGSGALLAFILGVLDGYNMTKADIADINSTMLTTHRTMEAFKYAFAKRSLLGDPNFVNITELLSNLSSPSYAAEVRSNIMDNMTFSSVDHYGAVFYTPDDHGTAHISVLSADGDAVSITSTINLYFGAGFTSKSTGIILNSVMDDFSFPGVVNFFGLPPSPNNFIAGGKRPLSSACPTVVVDPLGDVSMVIGASGGTKITTAVSWVIMRHLWFGENVKEAVDASRIHHQLFPMEISYEYGILKQVIDGLKALGHKAERYRDRGSIVCLVTKTKDGVFANADYRKGGEVFGID